MLSLGPAASHFSPPITRLASQITVSDLVPCRAAEYMLLHRPLNSGGPVSEPTSAAPGCWAGMYMRPSTTAEGSGESR